jgi:hypothetical protein
MGHPKENGKTGVGMKKPFITHAPKSFIRTGQLKPLRRVGRTRRGEQTRCLEVGKKVLVQEYCEVYGWDRYDEFKAMDLEHIHGHNKPGFKMGALLDPENWQLMNRADHAVKTSALTRDQQRADIRDVAICGRLIALSARLVAKLLPEGVMKFTAKEYRKAMRGELYGKT